MRNFFLPAHGITAVSFFPTRINLKHCRRERFAFSVMYILADDTGEITNGAAMQQAWKFTKHALANYRVALSGITEMQQ
jgi:hypothetical protein